MKGKARLITMSTKDENKEKRSKKRRENYFASPAVVVTELPFESSNVVFSSAVKKFQSPLLQFNNIKL